MTTTWYVYKIAGMYDKPDMVLHASDRENAIQQGYVKATDCATIEAFLNVYDVTLYPHHTVRSTASRKPRTPKQVTRDFENKHLREANAKLQRDLHRAMMELESYKKLIGQALATAGVKTSLNPVSA